tara:strand:- start:323 stop:763 length:441 start_codon:yes stop_codon:yes gene_type:complete
MNTEIFLPIFYMLCLTTAVFLFSTLIRIKEIYLNDSKNAISGSEHKHPPFQQGSDILKNSQRNLANLFEFPIFFYLVCVIIVITDKVDESFITLAYWFFYLRLVHSIYHIFFNQLIIKNGFPLRSLIWAPSTIVILLMWVKLISTF